MSSKPKPRNGHASRPHQVELSGADQAKGELLADKYHLQVVDVPLAKLEPARCNPRQISKKEKADLKNSMVQFGCVEPLVVRQEDYSIIGGHQRYYVGLELGLESLPCTVLDISEAEAKVLNVALNKIHGDWDVAKLENLLAEIELGPLDIDLTGFDEVSLDELGIGAESKEPAVLADVKIELPPVTVAVLAFIPLELWQDYGDYFRRLAEEDGLDIHIGSESEC